MELDDSITEEQQMYVDINVYASASDDTTTYEKQQSDMEVTSAEDSLPPKPFVNRVVNYPVVASTIGKCINLYSRCKESNDIVKYSLETAESGVKYVSASMAPVMNKLEKPLSTMDAVACSGLDIVEQKCPIITRPTDEVIATTKNAYETKLKPSVDRVAGIGHFASEKLVEAKNYGVSKVGDITSYSTEKCKLARDASIEKLSMAKDKSCEQIHAAIASETGQHVLNKLDNALTVAENYVDYYLPEKRDDDKPIDSDQPAEADEATSKSKPVVLYDKTKQRLYATAMSKLHDVQIRSRETLERLSFTVNLIDYAKINLNAVNERVYSSVQAARDKGVYWWDEIRKEEEDTEIEKGTLETQTMELQALSVARNLTRKLRLTLHSLNEKSVPEHLRDQFISAKQYSVELAGSFFSAKKFEDLSDTVMTKAHEQADYIRETVASLADVAADNWPLNQVTPDFVIDDLGNTDDEVDPDEFAE